MDIFSSLDCGFILHIGAPEMIDQPPKNDVEQSSAVKDGVELLRVFSRIKSETSRRMVIALATELATKETKSKPPSASF